MQPSWRKEGERLGRDTPKNETWQGLRKGGTAGLYVVLVGLSWWIKAQHAQRDNDAWTAVDDLSWVFQQMKKAVVATTSVAAKRVREVEDGEENGEAQPRKRYVDFLLF